MNFPEHELHFVRSLRPPDRRASEFGDRQPDTVDVEGEGVGLRPGSPGWAPSTDRSRPGATPVLRPQGEPARGRRPGGMNDDHLCIVTCGRDTVQIPALRSERARIAAPFRASSSRRTALPGLDPEERCSPLTGRTRLAPSLPPGGTQRTERNGCVQSWLPVLLIGRNRSVLFVGVWS